MHLCFHGYVNLRFEKSCNRGARQTVRSALLAVALQPLTKVKRCGGAEKMSATSWGVASAPHVLLCAP